MYISTLYRTSKQWICATFTQTSRKTKIVASSAVVLVVSTFGAAGFAPSDIDTSDVNVQKISTELPLPNLQEQILSLSNSEPYTNINKIRSGDTLASLLNRLNISDAQAFRFIQNDSEARALISQRPGSRVIAQTNEEGRLLTLRTNILNNGIPQELFINRTQDGFTAKKEAINLERRIEMRTGMIQSSLFAATDAADISDTVAMQMVDMFSTNINFTSDLRRGDQFKIIYESFWHDGHPIKTGRVLAGEFINDGQVYQALWYEDPKNKIDGGYYSLDGHAMKKAFLKYPLPFSRISSGFSPRRFHPVFGKWKRHTGVDFAAPTGTPIKASGDGVVQFVGTQNGYGNIVVLQHWNGYSTAYGHMSRFAKIKKGQKISQGEVIGYVGQTGWATGPHLHYEFRINNQPKDPMSVQMPTAQPLSAKALQRFKLASQDLTRRLTMLDAPAATTKMASAK